jgi:hypothetical protein
MRQSFSLSMCLVIAVVGLMGDPAVATTKGLNQIVTPDVQPYGQLSISYQQQDPNIGNPDEMQFELGITKIFELAAFQGFKPNEEVLNAELSLVQKGPYLLSTGFTNWATLGKAYAPEPFLEGGYYKGLGKFSAGAIRNGGSTQAIVGYAYQATPRMMFQVDYQSGSGNSSTVGFTYSVTPAVTFNPAVYYSNDQPHKAYAYAVLTWSVQAWQ